MTIFQGTEGTRPYAGVGWYYAEYRDRESPEFIALLATEKIRVLGGALVTASDCSDFGTALLIAPEQSLRL